MILILSALWYLLPAGIGNMTPVFVSRAPILKKWKTPIDLGKSWRGTRLLGNNKTIRGLVCGIIAGVIAGGVQKALYADMAPHLDLSASLYSGATPFILGGLLAAGALIGDATESFFKRQVGVPAGDSWFPFDQLDYIIGGCLFAAVLGALTIELYAAIFAIWFGLHLLSSYLGFLVHLKPKPI